MPNRTINAANFWLFFMYSSIHKLYSVIYLSTTVGLTDKLSIR